VIYLLLMNEIVNDVVVETIEIFGKSLNYRGDSAQNFISLVGEIKWLKSFKHFFYNKLTIEIFVPCSWYLWWSRTFVRGSRWTTVEYMKWDSFREPPSQHDDVRIILGESCVLLINTFVASFIILFEFRM